MQGYRQYDQAKTQVEPVAQMLVFLKDDKRQNDPIDRLQSQGQVHCKGRYPFKWIDV